MPDIQKLKVVRDFIVAHPEKLEMAVYYNYCQTTMCLAGWTVVLFDPTWADYESADEWNEEYCFTDSAQTILDLDNDQAHHLFHENYLDNEKSLINLNEFIEEHS